MAHYFLSLSDYNLTKEKIISFIDNINKFINDKSLINNRLHIDISNNHIKRKYADVITDFLIVGEFTIPIKKSNELDRLKDFRYQISLNLSYNKNKFNRFSDILSLNLFELNLSGNLIGDGIFIITDRIKSHPSIIRLSLISCDIGTEGGIAIAEMIKMNKTLVILNLSGNKLNNSFKPIIKSLMSNSTLKKLELESCEIRGGHDIADLIENNSSLEELYLGNNFIGAEGGLLIVAKALGFNNILKQLWINNIFTQDEGEEFINELFKNNSSITCLQIGNINKKLVNLIYEGTNRNHSNKKLKNRTLQERCVGIIKKNKINVELLPQLMRELCREDVINM